MNKLTEAQLYFLKSVERKARFIGGLGSGKSYTLTLFALAQALQSRIVLYILPTFRMIRDVSIPTLKQHLNNLGIKESDYELTVSPTQLVLRSGGTILFRSAEQGDSIRGINCHDLCLDESGYIDLELYKIAIGRVRNSSDGKIRAVGTPSGDAHWFSNWDADTSIQTTLANPFIPDEYKIDLIESYGGLNNPWARQELLGEVVGDLSPDVLVDATKWIDCINRPIISTNNLICSLDPSRFGNDNSAIAIRDNNHFVHFELKQRTDGPQLVEWIKSLYVQFGFNTLVVDTVGIGGFAYDFIKKELPDLKCIEFKGSGASPEKRIKNMRAYSWEMVRRFVEIDGSFKNMTNHLHMPLIKDQIFAQKKFFNDGKLQMMSKEEARRKGISSPDLADAIAMSLTVKSDLSKVKNKLYGDDSNLW